MATLLDRIQSSLAKEGLQPRTNAARLWLQTKIKSLNATPSTLMRDRNRQVTDTIIGKMYFYYYDPKTKEQMQYYDKFPLVIPIEEYRDGFLGINLHYIHPRHRLVLLDKLSSIATDRNYDENTRLRISYNYLKKSSRIYETTPCIKRYYFNNIKSRFLAISANEWDIAALLPAEQFMKASPSRVYAESEDKF
jgi:hypothetical protein